MKKISVFIPSTHKEEVKNAMFKAGAGQIGSYDCCSFEIEGKGQFRPLSGSNPYLGKKEKLETVKEFRVEMICPDDKIKSVVNAMRDAHPYETPAFDVVRLEDEY